MKNIAFYSFLILMISCNFKQDKNVESVRSKTYNYKDLEPLLSLKDDKVHVINFWATWCAPCVKELPAFEKLNAIYKPKNVEVLLVSLDFNDKIEKSLVPFLKKNKIQSNVILFDDPDQNSWIPKIDENWSGALPATLIYNKDKRAFYEQSFEYEDLEKEVKKFIK